ncbi:sodium-dependent transporter [Nocardioides panacisoli]|uniref:sodium-dependent transporter n=1 Tax=Nocardioides panacisoli TaxID=627624 RepID=UPI001C637A7A|nr:sodium-dependent transporter [Nocardioides panacisoli]QYJ04972.1 sodium-dependent transporter [Nocardioides panacisoli]
MTSTDAAPETPRRGSFDSRKVFILAAIGSAVGLGNIWRFPYVAYENGGGSFLLPYLVALLTAGIPFLLFDYAVGHRNRGSAPLSFARLARPAESLGWWQVGICFMIGVYYAAVLAWALRYTIFATDQAWGEDPNAFFFEDFLQAGDVGVQADLVPGIIWPLVVIWLVVGGVLLLGVQRGIGNTAKVFIPVLVVAFLALVVQSLFLDGAAQGLQALFEPNWAALGDPLVWAAAYGQIFFSLSIGFGIMITYASYVGRRTDMTGSGLVVGLSNSGFELLAGIGVFAALGFMAEAQGAEVDAVVSDGVGLAFVAFPAIINEAPGGALLGVLFFGSLVIAGLTSLISVMEVVISAVRDKLESSRAVAATLVLVPAGLISLAFFSTTSGLYVLDIVDYFINRFGILLVAVVSMIVVAWVLRALPLLTRHLDQYGTPSVRGWWPVLIGGVAPVALVLVLGREFYVAVTTPYGDYPTWMLTVFGWLPVGILVALAVTISVAQFVRRAPALPPPPGSVEARTESEVESE